MAMAAVYTTFGGMLVHEDRAGTERQYVRDPLGSLIGEIGSDQELTYSAEYWPYGEVHSEVGSRISVWGYVGLLGYLTDLINLLYVRARHFLPNRANWLTSDPQWPEQAAYNYAQGYPTLFVDPSGRNIACIGLGICVGIGIGALLACHGDLTCILCFLASRPFLKALLLGACSLALVACLGAWVEATVCKVQGFGGYFACHSVDSGNLLSINPNIFKRVERVQRSSGPNYRVISIANCQSCPSLRLFRFLKL